MERAFLSRIILIQVAAIEPSCRSGHRRRQRRIDRGARLRLQKNRRFGVMSTHPPAASM
jgi:hypothetical protein